MPPIFYCYRFLMSRKLFDNVLLSCILVFPLLLFVCWIHLFFVMLETSRENALQTRVWRRRILKKPEPIWATPDWTQSRQLHKSMIRFTCWIIKNVLNILKIIWLVFLLSDFKSYLIIKYHVSLLIMIPYRRVIGQLM